MVCVCHSLSLKRIYETICYEGSTAKNVAACEAYFDEATSLWDNLKPE